MIPYSTVSVPSTFPPASRPIYLYPIAEVTHKNKELAWPKLVLGINEIAIRNPESRILIHTVSYDLTRYLLSSLTALADPYLSSRMVSYTSADQRQRSLDLYLTIPNSILLAPSLDRGIDLPGDDCRAIVVCKVPFPNLGDKQISARMHGRNGNLWYAVNTVRAMVQMTGRGMRSKEDYCESYILDSSFVSNIWKKHRSLLPGWWVEALDWNAGRLI